MRNQERRANLDKLEEAIDKELLYDTDENYPDKYELNEDLITGDSYARNTVIDTYKNMNSMYGIFRSSHHKYNLLFIIIPVIMNIASLGMLIAMLIKGSETAVFALVIEVGFLFLGYFAIKFAKGKKFYVYMFKEGGKNIIIYKHPKQDMYVVYLGKNQICMYEYEEWHEIAFPYHVGGRLMFQYLCGELMVKEHRSGVVEIYCRNRAFFELKCRRRYQKSADLLIKNGKPWRINYYNEIFPDENGNSRAQNSEQIEFLEINSDRVVQIPKSFLKFCEKAEIEPPKESEHLRYI